MLLDLSTWWSGMGTFEQVYWIIALPSTLIFLILLVLTFVGGDLDDAGGPDADVAGDDGVGFQFFSLKNVVGFFTLFAWSGLACIDADQSQLVTLVVSIISGFVMMTVMASIFYFMSKLTDSGTLDMRNAVNGIGEVYLPIKKQRGGFGKVQINVQGGLRTLQAMTDDGEDLPMGTVVQVQDIINDQILLVTKSSN
ncbi:hypothetical protein KFE98_00280 [bacterium SCSIO 12741]|nr:hypothetical protein KFE98_00280 [bacterium SCSIO 12741]